LYPRNEAMKILDHFQHLTLTEDQRNAVTQLHDFLNSDERVFILKGYAGSGKTTLLKGLVDYLVSLRKHYQLMAPTGRAAKVINQKTGFESTTVHKGIYSFDNLEEIDQNEEDKNISFIYQYKLRNNSRVHDSVLIIDESSMVSDVLSQGEFFRFGSGNLLGDLFDYCRIQDGNTTSKVIFIGDPAQLPPIGMAFSPALDSKYLKETYHVSASSCEMKEVKRQEANNGILISATNIRKSLTSGYFNDFDLRENARDIFNPSIQNFLETYKAEKGQKIIISYKNKTAQDINKGIRRDKFGGDLPIQPTDTIIIGANNYNVGLMNGEFAIVAEAVPSTVQRDIIFKKKGGGTQSVRLVWRQVTLVLPDNNGQPQNISGYILENFLKGDNLLKPEEQRALYVDFKTRHPNLKKGTEEFKQAITSDPFFNCIMLKYGYAVTCHKAQGGEWQSAFVFWDRGAQSDFNFYSSVQNKQGKTNADFYRWAYTAITRASKKLFCINPPHFTSFSELTYTDVNVQKAYDQLSGQSSLVIKVELTDEINDALKQFGLINSPASFQDHFIFQWYHLQQHGIAINGWEQKGYEIRYTYKKEDKTCGIKYWINGKNEFNTKSQMLEHNTNSAEFYATTSAILSEAPEIEVKREYDQEMPSLIEFDKTVEEEKPFLKMLFNGIDQALEVDEKIEDLQHLEWKERYTIKKGSHECKVDFEYNSKGFIGRVVPIVSKANDQILLNRIKLIANHLKESAHVI
jgi:tRNA A37 threonylcarbamoyladenosine biosynthesis protein TsaE